MYAAEHSTNGPPWYVKRWQLIFKNIENKWVISYLSKRLTYVKWSHLLASLLKLIFCGLTSFYRIRATNISPKAFSDTSTIVSVYMHAEINVLSLPSGQNQDEWLISCLVNNVTNWWYVKMFSPFHKNCDASFWISCTHM